MTAIAKNIANNASFQAFMNCYLREVDAGVWHSCDTWKRLTGLEFNGNETKVLELQLPKLDTTLAIGVRYYSLVGRHRLTQVYQQQEHFDWLAMDTLSVISLLIDNLYTSSDSSANQVVSDLKLELLSRTIESHQVMTHYIDQRMGDPRLQSAQFIDSEQSILFGHWLHPTPKSRQGIHDWQHSSYTPELGGHFQLHFFAADRQLVQQSSILTISAEEVIKQIITKDPATKRAAEITASVEDEQVLIPVHPLQAQWLLHQDYIQQLIQQGQLIDLGPLGAKFTPTSSVRTLYCEELEYMIKLSIPVKITNSLRLNMRSELTAGIVVAKLLRNTDFSKRFPKFKTIDDPAYLTLNLPGMEESGFELIIRENPFSKTTKTSGSTPDETTYLPKTPKSVQSIAAIVQDPLDPSSPSKLAAMVHRLAKKKQISLAQAGVIWFEAYWDCAIDSIINLYDSYGVALEAHQQNSLLDVSEDYPTRYYYRDNQGFYLSQTLRPKLLQLEPGLQNTDNLFYPDSMICDRCSYYLIINQLFSVINRFGLDDLVSEQQLIEICRDKLTLMLPTLQSVGKTLIHSILDRQEIPCKGNLLTRVKDVDELQVDMELAVYTNIRNPLFVNKPAITSLAIKLATVNAQAQSTGHEAKRESA